VFGVEIPGLGTVVKNPEYDWHHSSPVEVPVLGGLPCRFIVDSYENDTAKEDFDAAIRTFLALDRSVLEAAAPHIYAYYRAVTDDVLAAGDDEWYVEITGPDKVLDHVRFDDEPMVTRDYHVDRHVYISLSCDCDWEPEHGLQIVFRDGAEVTKVGPPDGHLTNVAAYDDDSLDGVIYRALG
jgi:hypothetical protein